MCLERLARASLHWSTTIPQEGEVWRDLDNIVRDHLDVSHLRICPRPPNQSEPAAGAVSTVDRLPRYLDLSWALVNFCEMSDGRYALVPERRMPQESFTSWTVRRMFEEVSLPSSKGDEATIWMSELYVLREGPLTYRLLLQCLCMQICNLTLENGSCVSVCRPSRSLD